MSEEKKTHPVDGADLLLAAARKFNPIKAIQRSHTLKIVMIGFLVLLLQIPIFMIRGVVMERKQRSNEATEEVAAKWGRTQHIIGPFITVPYEREVAQKGESSSGNLQPVTVLEYANFLPEGLVIDAKAETLRRHRGIFEVPVYRMDLAMKGRFVRPDFSQFPVQPSRILWEQAKVTVLITDPRAITNQASLTWNGEEIAFEPGGNEFSDTGRGIRAGLRDKLSADSFTFSFRLTAQGSTGVFFSPVGKNTEATLASDWSDPSFQGNWLPSDQQTGKNGFVATWRIPALGRNFPQYWVGTSAMKSGNAPDSFGVNFILPVDHYRMAERSIKYQFLFLALTFITLWLIEILSKIQVHAVQYLLVGAGMCLFYLLELSLAEHLGFLWAYLLASASIVLLESFYCLAILNSPKRSAWVGGFITMLYAYLYLLLINQDYALLAGSVGLFLLLGGIMYLTRNINWYGAEEKRQTEDGNL